MTMMQDAQTADVKKIKFDRMKRRELDKALEVAGVEKAKTQNGVPAKVNIEADAKALLAHYYRKMQETNGQVANCDVGEGGCGADSPAELSGCPFCGMGDQPKTNGAAIVHVATKEPTIAKLVKQELAASKKFVPPPVQSQIRNLDESVARIVTLKTGMLGSLWDVGDELRNQYENDLWKQRVNADKKLAYKSFSEFLRKETDFTERYAFELINAAACFTRDDVVQIGVTKLEVIARVPEQWRPVLMERAKQGLPRRELVEQAKEFGSGATVRDTGRKGFRAGKDKVKPPQAKSKAKEARAAKAMELGKQERPEGSIAIVLLTRRSTVALVKKGSDVRAKRIADMPVGQLPLANGQQLHLKLLADPSGNLKIIVELGQ